ncbi:MAG: bifunctional glycosyltransferase/class I SAM-dependent methyltransferase [Polyangia bacterium]
MFVVAYYAESTLRKVLERIPSALFREYDCEILVIDDGSEDRTFAIGQEYRAAHPDIQLTVLRNEFNQGYGGNQKIGYAYAKVERFDVVALLHGDAQYAPEELPNLVAPIAKGEADAVFGSRMMTSGTALKGGMPLYKYVGNKILTGVQNLLLGTRLSEFHSGFRVYSVPALAKLPFRLNSNDFHFDTEIIIQLLNAKARITELPIPTYYGDEICRVNGMKYAKDVMMATLKNTAHRSGILYQRRFDSKTERESYDLKLGYPSSHTYAIDAVPPGVKVLDVGGGSGGIARELAKKGCEVCVVDQYEPAHKHPGLSYQTRDLDASPPEIKGFSHILMLDIIEHVLKPEVLVDQLRAQMTYEKQTLIITTPNIAFAVQRLQLLLGQFNYNHTGILDFTHRRLFNFRSLIRLLRDAGFRIKEVKGVPAPFPKALGDGPLARALLRINVALIGISKTLFSYQIYVVAEGTPDLEFLLKSARESNTQQALDTATG